MKNPISKIPTPLKEIIIFIVIIISLTLIISKTGLSKKILNNINKEIIDENKKLKKDNQEIDKKRKTDSIEYYQVLEKKIAEIEKYQTKYNNSLLTIKKYEKAINDYRTGDFDNNFATFAKFVSNPSAIQSE